MNKFIIFDLDGTLIDTLEGIYVAINKTLEELNINKVYTKEEVKGFIGNGVGKLFERALKRNYTSEEMDHLLINYEKYQYVSKPFEGVIETLDYFKNNGYSLFIYSNKPEHLLQKLCEYSFDKSLFKFIKGEDKNFPRKPDNTFLKYLFKEYGLKSEEGYYVGDSYVDVLTAKNMNLRSIILSYGYGDLIETKKHNPDYIIDEFKRLKEIIR